MTTENNTQEVEKNVVRCGNCIDKMKELPANSVHAVVTDPPYGLAFMGRDWDDFEPREYQRFCAEWAREAKRVLKPGGHLLAFSGNRTHHRLFAGVEDAGFEIRDTITWHYGSGFPKASDISKTIDKQADAEREVVSENPNKRSNEAEARTAGKSQSGETIHAPITEPATDAAKKWEGWKTGLKPSTEFVVLARAPLGEGTITENVLEHGTGALNIDACRIPTNDDWDRNRADEPSGDNVSPHVYGDRDGIKSSMHDDGRYPPNTVFDEIEAEKLDSKNGERESPTGVSYRHESENNSMSGKNYERLSFNGYGDSGGPSRYYYTSKASSDERTVAGKRVDHPTVKPLDLMEWLIKLVTREGQIVLDPFAGTGTTLEAAKGCGREFIGIEKKSKWVKVARIRVGLETADSDFLEGPQQSLDEFAEE